MRPAYILAAAVLILFLIGQVRVGGQAKFHAEGFFLWLRLGRVQIQILPAKPRAEKKPKKSRRNVKPKRSKKPKKEKEPVPLPEKIGGAVEYAQALLPIALEAAGGMLRGLRVDRLELELTAGASDPADAAMLYGRATAALGALWLPLTKAFRVKDGFARVYLDFNAPGMTVYGTAALSIKIGTVVWIGMRVGCKALFGVLAARRRLKRKQQYRKAA